MTKDITEDKKSYPYIHRDVSWLYFNERVLQEAEDLEMPLFEKIKFLAIYSNNLGEFFRVRVANLRNLVRVGKKTKRKLDYDPKEIIKRVLKIVNEQQVRFSEIFNEQIIPQLRNNNIHLLRYDDLGEEQKEFVNNYIQDDLQPHIQPVLLVKNKIRPFLNNSELYLAILLKDKSTGLAEVNEHYAILKIPSEYLPRFIELPNSDGRHDIIMLDDIVRRAVTWMFPGYHIVDSYSIKLTRDAELYIDDEFSGDLLLKIKNSLKKRNVGPASRLVYDANMPDQLLDFLIESFELDKYDLLPEGRYHNNFDFFKFPSFGNDHMKNTPLPPLPYPALTPESSIFEEIKKKDHLVHFPYHTYEPVIRFFEDAANDPNVSEIRIVQYRVAKKSRIMQALMKAARSGKKVFAFIEIKARFDEEANLNWGESLEKAGVKVHYSFPGLKVHSKLALVKRIENEKTRIYTYLSSGNFHEDTAKIYTDLGFFTADKKITREVNEVFSILESVDHRPKNFQHLLVGQFNLRPDLKKMINKEIANAKAGKTARMILKMNSLEDKEMIIKLYEASQAGVKIKMIIRGLCCLTPGIKGLSENIEVISIVDRFLEHSRVFIFHNGGDEKVYVSSADWMYRNLSKRIETVFPIYDNEIKKEIKSILAIQLQDNVKARIIDRSNQNLFSKGNSEMPVRSQTSTYYYYKNKTIEEV
ncbi:MAG: polyphosphate kinase 1 [Saprospiraceae bacterium]